ncbi:transposase [Candidatus Peregrinibacteria bacterium CG_4_10_14_0_2_um_filter_43_11]|nr:MAG: transposase [Candidatus Peregrinibacteria bacterium CG_4_10_14_0_2_um_filter_43_11]
MAYSLDFRKRVMRIKEETNLTFEATSERFGIGIRTLFRWQNSIEPKTTRNKPATKINMEKLAADVKKYPDDFHYERAGRFGASITGIFYAMKRLGITYKKNPKSPRGRSYSAQGIHL